MDKALDFLGFWKGPEQNNFQFTNDNKIYCVVSSLFPTGAKMVYGVNAVFYAYKLGNNTYTHRQQIYCNLHSIFVIRVYKKYWL